MNHPKFTIFTGKDNQYYFRLTARNGEIILGSEGYKSKSGCKNGIQSVKENAPGDDRYDRRESSNGQFYFVLVAKNGEPIGRSEMYTTAQGRDNGIKAVKNTAPNAPIDDTSA
ncbi:MAG: YegP family protein [Anaerolineales bacterium]|nr:YegP family protein [Anaerolineales bacterium]MBS3753533.1 YegP family protein [Anaerolineales bacterium]